MTDLALFDFEGTIEGLTSVSETIRMAKRECPARARRIVRAWGVGCYDSISPKEELC